MISATDLQEHPGVVIADDMPGYLHFTVRARGMKKGISVPVVLDVICPLVKQRPLWASSTIVSVNELEVPAIWTPDNIENLLTQTLMLARADMAREVQREQEEDSANITRRIQEKVLSQLKQAAADFTSGPRPDEEFTLSRFMALCGEAYSSAQSNAPRHPNPGATSGSTDSS